VGLLGTALPINILRTRLLPSEIYKLPASNVVVDAMSSGAPERAEIAVSTLPADASVAGEWFLGVPRYSAAPDVGLRLIQLYTSHEAEIDRLKYGVGLPVRTNFYDQRGRETTPISPYFSMDTSHLFKAIEGALRRSSFGCYRRYASILSTHLQSVPMLPRADDEELEKNIKARVDGLRQRLEFVGISQCSSCSSTAFAKRPQFVREPPVNETP
jgi:hypothetical protein